MLKMTVLKDGQLTGGEVRYDTLDTSRNSVVNLGRVLNTPLPLRDVMEGGIVKEDSLEPVNVPGAIVDSVLLRDKSKEPERFVQPLHALVPSELNDIGAKVSTPVPLQSWKALSPILVILEEKDAVSLLHLANALWPIDVRFWVLKIFRMLVADSNALLGIAVNPDTSNEPEIPQFRNADAPNDRKDKVGHTNPPERPQCWNANALISVMVEGRVPVSLLQLRNA